MTDEVLTKEAILDAAESVLRKFGPAKANMSDVGRALGVSHAALYRHYDSKSALRYAVVERWINTAKPLLQAVAEQPLPADDLIYQWIRTLSAFKKKRATEDPELFEMYSGLVRETEDLMAEHVEFLVQQLSRIIASGVKAGLFDSSDPRRSGLAIFLATTRFHHPSHASEWTDPDYEERLNALCEVLLIGLRRR